MYEEIDYDTAGEEIQEIASLLPSDSRIFLERYSTHSYLRIRVEGFYTFTKDGNLLNVANHPKFCSIQNGIGEGKVPFIDFVFKFY